MARVELPQSRLRARKRQKYIRMALWCAAALAVLVGALAALARAPFLQIQTVAVSGSSVATSSIDALARGRLAGSYFFIFPKDNIFLYPKEDITEALERAYPALKSVDVHAQDFHTVAVVVVERQPAALWCAQGGESGQAGCYYMDEDGVAYAPAEASSSDALVTYFGGGAGSRLPWQYVNSDEFHALTSLVAALSQTEAANPVREVAVTDDGDVLAYFQNSFLLLFTLAQEGGDVYERFALALKSDPFHGKTLGDFEYLDLRFGDKLYYKLKNQ